MTILRTASVLRTTAATAALLSLGAVCAGPAQADQLVARDSMTAKPVVPFASTSFQAYSFATSISGAVAGSGIKAGTTASSYLGCSSKTGRSDVHKVAAVDSKVLQVGAISTTATSQGSTTSRTSRSTTTTAGVSALNGLIKATALSTSSSSTVRSSGSTSGSSTMKAVGLTVAGKKISGTVAPNTTIALAVGGVVIGKVVLNEQSTSTVGGYTYTRVNALDVSISAANNFGLKTGARVVVGHSSASLAAVPVGYSAGGGYVTNATLADGTVQSKRTAYAAVQCAGGSSQAALAATSPLNLLKVGVATVKTNSVTTPALSTHVETSIASVGVLANLIKVSGLYANTRATREKAGGKVTLTDGSHFASLSVAGLPGINAHVAPNTTINLGGLGSITFRKQVKTATSIRVTMIYIVIGQPLPGLPTGSVVEVGVSDSSVR